MLLMGVKKCGRYRISYYLYVIGLEIHPWYFPNNLRYLSIFWNVVRLSYKEEFGKKKFRKEPCRFLSLNFVYHVTLGI